MLEEKKPKLAQLQQFIDPQSKLLRTWSLKGGISAQMTAFEVLLPDGQTKKMIRRSRLRRDRSPKEIRDATAKEFKTLQLMQSIDVVTPTPYYLDLSADLFPMPYLVMQYIEGQPEYQPANITSDSAFQMATQLAKIHRIDGLTHDLSFLPKQSTKHVLTMEGLPDLPLQTQNQPVLLHGDFWPGNMLWQDGKLVAVVDWEDAKVGNPLEDLAIRRFDLLFIFGIEVMNEFTSSYKAMSSIDFTTLPYWDLYATRRAASGITEWAAGWPQLGRPDLTEKAIREAHQWFIKQAFEALSMPS